MFFTIKNGFILDTQSTVNKITTVLSNLYLEQKNMCNILNVGHLTVLSFMIFSKKEEQKKRGKRCKLAYVTLNFFKKFSALGILDRGF